MDLDWTALGSVALVGVGATVALVVVFTLGVTLLAGPARDPEEHHTATRTAAVLCFTACVVAALYGLYLVVPQFHGG
ncbi:hypothetical protein ACGFZL_19895 [Streptomyces sp. NPDC048182]|uniref:hypothetical protein n=1 Tax=Streptomyces sp. NPDC048182 TaxID=3365507 RepID=UPI00371A3D17